MHVTVPLCMMTWSNALVYSCECLLFWGGGGVVLFYSFILEPIFLCLVLSDVY